MNNGNSTQVLANTNHHHHLSLFDFVYVLPELFGFIYMERWPMTYDNVDTLKLKVGSALIKRIISRRCTTIFGFIWHIKMIS